MIGRQAQTFLTLLGILACLFSGPSWAQSSSGVQLYEWTPGQSMAPLILPVRSSETPQAAARRYLNNLKAHPDLVELLGGHIPDFPESEFKALENSDLESRALLISNLPKDYGQNSVRVKNFIEIFKQAGHESYILPINANLGLSTSEAVDLKNQIADKFPFLVAMGGDDVDPHLYDEHHTLTKLTVPTRDRFEVSLIKSYVEKSKGFLLGICRGSQLSAVALGYKLVQDIPILVEKAIPHANDWHPIKIHETRFNILKNLADAQGEIRVNSLHHQSVRFVGNGLLSLAATSADGVTEATELKNGRGLLLQFHPELMGNRMGTQILHKVLEVKTQVVPPRCSRSLL